MAKKRVHQVKIQGGASPSVYLRKSYLETTDMEPGDEVNVEFKKDKIIITKVE